MMFSDRIFRRGRIKTERINWSLVPRKREYRIYVADTDARIVVHIRADSLDDATDFFKEWMFDVLDEATSDVREILEWLDKEIADCKEQLDAPEEMAFPLIRYNVLKEVRHRLTKDSKVV